MLLTGRSSAVELVDGRVRLYQLVPDGRVLHIDTPVADLARADSGKAVNQDTGMHHAVLRLIFDSPNLRWLDEVVGRDPVFVVCDGDDPAPHDAARVLTHAIITARRIRLDLPDATPVPVLPGQPRSDLQAAAARVVGICPGPDLLTELHPLLLPTEFVLEIAPIARGLLVATTARVLEMPYHQPLLREVPVDALAAMTLSPDGRQAILIWVRGHTPLDPGDPRDLARIASAVEFAISRRRDDDVAGPARPDVRVLAQEWETLHQYYELGMTTPEDAARTADGILSSLPS
ncbi:hypothetical protein KEM60_02730 [Austwickia sp. TVS 96-490-7B]|uniref:hypothetical protein n=1 Tax=Austwickia sp. TVS 96-490-7B TaxID=2830843 RepID=UPI001C55F039|nr:hypothetical protein [Austwickia sp. TVS 96-490-7B]MBW3086509.1 hypothetical protein [Austwickia sp. TVS 96-490-7B]